ncbi:MAG TPA: hypothetical protein VD886_19705 [Herpetosiphonaceae bacterium]|nr:hypothetical protein [Herpetosiphonaceae bacterium]
MPAKQASLRARFNHLLWEPPTPRPSMLYLCMLNLGVLPLGMRGGFWAINLCIAVAFGLLALADYRASASTVGWVRLSALLAALLAILVSLTAIIE